MRIGLADVDGHNFPNLALMKLSAWHKAQGDSVEMIFPMASYDRVYMSKVFSFTPDFNTCIDAKEIIKGGTGYDMTAHLSDEVESMYPDYSLYGITDTAYGYLTRGCPRNCPFCIVGDKEGLKSYKVSNLDGFWNGQKEIKLLDPNLLACKEHISLLEQLAESQAWVDFTQGLDARLLTSGAIALLNRIKIKEIHFAWDREKDSDKVLKGLKLYAKHCARKPHGDYGQVYVLTNYDTDFEFDLHRIYTLRAMGYDPYVMIYNKQNAPKQIRRLQRWVNNKFIFRKCEKFEDYKN